ncbi:hypothetical protein FACS1894170_06240 [Planctomycetales bacterium]|nr:hypothetical protein FACS1894170_06240 [Planctomycetales bacterium]
MFTRHHPAGLWVLFTTELWERFAYYAMRAILVLYLVSETSKESAPGLGWNEADAYTLYGWYTGLVYLSPLLGGWIADKFIGQKFSVVIGAITMALGEFALASTELVHQATGEVGLATNAMFYLGLFLMVMGNGFFKPCISVMVGQMYGPEEHTKRDIAFTIFYMGINIGAFFSPLVAGTVAEKFGFQYGFIIAGIGMLIGLLAFTTVGKKYIAHLGNAPIKTKRTSEPEHQISVHEVRQPLTRKDYDKIWVIIILTVFSIAFFISFEQAGSSLNVFAKRKTERNISENVMSVLPPFISKNTILRNEDFLDYKNSVTRLDKLAIHLDTSDEDTKKEQNVKRKSFWEQLKQMFFSKPKEEERSIEEQIAEIKVLAKELKIKLRTSKDEDVQKAIAVMEEAIHKDDIIIETIPQQQTDAKTPETVAKAEVRKNALLEAIKILLVNEQGQWGQDIQEGLVELDKSEKVFESKYVPGKNTFSFPASWYQSVNPLGIILFAPLFAIGWGMLARWRIEPSTPVKFALGLILVSAGYLIMLPGAIEAQKAGLAAAYWLVCCYVLQTWGELCLSPVGLSMVTKLAPHRYQSLLMGFWLLGSCVAQILGGYVAAVLGSGGGIKLFFGENGGLADFFLILAAIPFSIGILALFLSPMLKRMMHGIH